MRSFLLRIAIVGAGLALLAAPGVGSAPGRESDRVVLDLVAGPLEFEKPEGGEGSVPRLPGFGLASRPGEPALPFKILLVAIPEGSVPELVLLESHARTLAGLVVPPVPRIRVRERLPNARGAALGRGPGREDRRPDIQEYDQEFAPDARIFDSDEEFPASPLRLGRTGYLREQRYVEVIFHPVLYNPLRRQARFHPRVRAEVRFEPPAGAIGDRPFRPDPRFESVYSSSLVNYEQGKRFRVPAGEAAHEEARGDGTAATEEGAPAVPATSAAPGRSLLEGGATPHTPGSEVYKIIVSAPGVYRLTHGYLSANAPAIPGFDPRTLVLRAEGVEVPVSIRNATTGGSGEADGVFGGDDFLEFYGLPKVEPPTVLNFDLGTLLPWVYEANDFTDTQVYWLSSEGSPGSHLRIPEASGAPGAPAKPLATDFQETAVWEENNTYSPLGDADPFFSVPSLLAQNGVAQGQRDLSVPLPGLAAVSTPSSLTVRLRGWSSQTADPDHRTRAWVNNNTGGAADFTWDAEVIREETFTVSQSLLTNPVTVHVQAAGLAGIAFDSQVLDTVKIQYRRTFASAGDALTFSYPNQDARFQVSGFSDGTPVIYEVGRLLPGSDQANPVRLTGGTVTGAPSATCTFEVAQDTTPGAPALRKFVIAGPGGLKLPAGVTQAADRSLTSPDNAADYLVIAATTTVDASPGGALDNLLAHRLATQGLTSRVVYVNQIYDEFSHGLRNPNAIRAFLAHAFDTWRGPGGTAPPPSFVLLVGDATPDFKNNLSRPDWVDQVPTPIMFQASSTIGFYSSDNWLASFRGDDQLPDISLGRISTRSAAESAAVFNKILQYETAPPPGLWKGRAALVTSEGNDVGESASFMNVQNGLASDYFSAPPFSAPSPPLYFDQPPWSTWSPEAAVRAANFNDALVNEIDTGAAILSYVGHGGFNVWGLTTFYTTQDALSQTNGTRLPFMWNSNCLSGGFHFLLGSGAIGEGLVNNPNGGAIAALAPSGLSNSFVGSVVADELFTPIFGSLKERVLGPSQVGLRTALWSRGSIVDLQSYTYLGDPATVLATPAPPPPTGLSASAGNSQVTLSWTAPPVPAAYRIYRALNNPAGLYGVVTCDPLTSTSCVDRTALNAKTYYYRAVSVDPDGFEGRASNQNGDCDLGPDCVVARPINPGPPAAPTGLAAHDPGTGGRLTIVWNTSPEPDLLKYTLYYGTLPGAYTASATAQAPATTLALGGLQTGTRYYLALSATNTSGLESALSPEVSEVPHLIQGIAPPRAISDLTVSRSGPDLLLAWSRPLVNIYGLPTTVGGYRLYRGTTPGFVPSAATLIATLNGGASTSYTDSGAVSLGNVYYLVTAWDASDPTLVSGAGRDLPNGVGDLMVTWMGGDTLRLTWSAVGTDVQGLPTVVNRYRIYVSAIPFGRTSIGGMTPLSGLTPVDSGGVYSLDLDVPGVRSYISVIVEDNRGNLSPF